MSATEQWFHLLLHFMHAQSQMEVSTLLTGAWEVLAWHAGLNAELTPQNVCETEESARLLISSRLEPSKPTVLRQLRERDTFPL